MTYSILSRERGLKALVQDHQDHLVLELWDLEHDEIFDVKMVVPEEGRHQDALEQLIVQARAYVTGQAVGDILSALSSYEASHQ